MQGMASNSEYNRIFPIKNGWVVDAGSQSVRVTIVNHKIWHQVEDRGGLFRCLGTDELGSTNFRGGVSAYGSDHQRPFESAQPVLGYDSKRLFWYSSESANLWFGKKEIPGSDAGFLCMIDKFKS
jgi:hypothetical protein